MNAAAGRNPLESFANYSQVYEVAKGTGKLIEPRTFIYPGCEGITMADLIKAFEGDIGRLQESTVYAYNILLQSGDLQGKDEMVRMARAAGLPYNVDVDREENAAYIATLLLNAGLSHTKFINTITNCFNSLVYNFVLIFTKITFEISKCGFIIFFRQFLQHG